MMPMITDKRICLPFICGVTWGFGSQKGEWLTQSAEESFAKLCKSTALNTLVLAVTIYQKNAHSVEVDRCSEQTVSDEEIIKVIRLARSKGIRVILKPIVNLLDGTWRAYIDFFDIDVPCEPKWSEWFDSYSQSILHYAQLAQQSGCFMLCIGCELVQAQRREKEWRGLIDKVRCAYGGLLTFNADKYQEGEVAWWDAVDIISSSGYYPINDWTAQLDRIEKTVIHYDKPFFFIEAGCPSRQGASFVPNNWELAGDVSLEEQRSYYEAMFKSVKGREWFDGFGLWDWPAEMYPQALVAANDGYCVYGKPAQQEVFEYYKSFQ